MKIKEILSGVLLYLLVVGVFVYASHLLTSFSDSTTTGNLTFNPTQDSPLCHQQFTNVSETCGAFDTGTYTINDVTMTDPSFAFDGDYNTMALGSTLYSDWWMVNYTKPTWATGMRWDVKRGQNSNLTNNITIPIRCWNNNLDYISINFTTSDGVGEQEFRAYCWDADGEWSTIDIVKGVVNVGIWEESAHWLIDTGDNHTKYITLGLFVDVEGGNITLQGFSI